MPDLPTLLREYARTLDAEIWPDRLASADTEFWRRTPAPDSAAMKVATTAMWDAHVARVEKRGSPADCDEALRKAIREMTG